MNQLKILRKQRNISQADIAERLGIKPAAVSKYETGRVPLSEDCCRYPQMNFWVFPLFQIHLLQSLLP